MWILALALAVLPLTVLPARADSFVYTVTGSLTITGMDVCGGPCVETLRFAVPFEWVPAPANQYGVTHIGSWASSSNVDSSGPLAPFTLSSRIGGAPQGPYYFPFFNGQGDEIDIYVALWTSTPELPPTFVPNTAALYACRSSDCVTAMLPPGTIERSGFGDGNGIPGTSTVTATRVPEPISLLLTGIGIAALAGFSGYRRI